MGRYIWPQKKGHLGPKAAVISGRRCSSSRGTELMPEPGAAGVQPSPLSTTSHQLAELAVLSVLPFSSPFACLFCVVKGLCEAWWFLAGLLLKHADLGAPWLSNL